MPRNHISAKTRGLGVELKELRTGAGLNTREAAKKVGLSSATLNRIELGTRPATPEEVFGLLIVYDVPILERERLLDLAREAVMPGWWEGSTYSGLSKHLYALANFESAAIKITSVQPSLVPGLLQTPAYMRAVLTCLGNPAAEVEKLVAIRAGRQMALGKPGPPQFRTIIDEGALRRRVGDSVVMVEQIQHILAVMNQPNITVQVIPAERGGHQGMISPFDLIEFVKAPAVVYLEHLYSSVFLDQHSDTQPFQQAIQSLVATALEPAESTEILVRVAAEYEQG